MKLTTYDCNSVGRVPHDTPGTTSNRFFILGHAIAGSRGAAAACRDSADVSLATSLATGFCFIGIGTMGTFAMGTDGI